MIRLCLLHVCVLFVFCVFFSERLSIAYITNTWATYGMISKAAEGRRRSKVKRELANYIT